MSQPKRKLTASITLPHSTYGSESKLWSKTRALQKEIASTAKGKSVNAVIAKRERFKIVTALGDVKTPKPLFHNLCLPVEEWRQNALQFAVGTLASKPSFDSSAIYFDM
jgi:hypothetical protein